MDKDFKITVITPVYNAETYLEETLACVAEQTIGFEENIQHILVNDGSTDHSGEMCSSYAAAHPDNVLYIEKENGGVSSARNLALKHVKGKYTVFLDGDDVWETDAFKRIADFFDAHHDEVDVCSCRLKYKGTFAEMDHPQDYKYEGGSRIADLEELPSFICTPIGNSVFKSTALAGRTFETDMTYCEDTYFQNMIIAEKAKIGIIADAVFYYRKNAGEGNASIQIPKTARWYFDIPKTYYLRMIDSCMEKFGKVPRFIQETLIYDIKWRIYTEEVVESFTEDQKQEHLALMKEVLSHIDDEIILGTPDVVQYMKLYMLDLKHGKEVIREASFENDNFYFDGRQVLSLRGRSFLLVTEFDITDNILTMEGIFRGNTVRRPYALEIRNEEGTYYDVMLEDWPEADIRGYIGEMISKGELFRTRIPLKDGRKLHFIFNMDGERIPIRPTFDQYIRIDRGQKYNYTVKSGYIIRLRKDVLSFTADSKMERLRCEVKLDRDLKRKQVPDWRQERRDARRMISAVNDSRLKERIAFVSVRADGRLLDNMKAVYDLIDSPKTFYSSRQIDLDFEEELKAAKLTYTSKVVVTDDYLTVFRNNKKKDGQYYIQLWHAAGAFKTFGKDSDRFPPGMDRMYHRDYDLMCVSSEYVRDIYANTLQIDRDRVRALGVPRTDRFFDKQYLSSVRESVYDRMPELGGRQVILYAPTFRSETSGRVYLPPIDYAGIDAALNDDQIFVVCPHPLMPPYEGKWNYDKIRLVTDISTNDMMIAADLMITDYSSVIFEFSLLDKPIVFFCYDQDRYDRDFYLDYEKDLPGEKIKTIEELRDYLGSGKFEKDERLDSFREKYMSACDGNSSKRIAEVITEYLHK